MRAAAGAAAARGRAGMRKTGGEGSSAVHARRLGSARLQTWLGVGIRPMAFSPWSAKESAQSLIVSWQSVATAPEKVGFGASADLARRR